MAVCLSVRRRDEGAQGPCDMTFSYYIYWFTKLSAYAEWFPEYGTRNI